MTTEETIRRLFATLENAVRSIAGIDTTSNGLRDWFRPNHHIGHRERWNTLRELRAANNRDSVIWYAEILDDVSAMLESVNSVYERSIPKFPQVTFDDRTLEPIDATRELLSAVIDWHSADGGYWEYQDATGADDAQAIQAQIELSESLYPMREAEGRELVAKLRHARGVMLLTLDTMPTQRPEVTHTKGPFTGKQLLTMFGFRHSTTDTVRGWIRNGWIVAHDKKGPNGSSRFTDAEVQKLAIKLDKQPNYPKEPTRETGDSVATP